jgi:hypothetical protein
MPRTRPSALQTRPLLPGCKMAREKFVELHPEVTQAPPAGTLYDGTILLRADGKVLHHSIRTVAPEALHWSRNDPNRELPNDGGEPFGDYLRKGTQLADTSAVYFMWQGTPSKAP